MKYLIHLILLTGSLLPLHAAFGDDKPELVLEDGEFELTIPFLLFNGDTFRVNLHTPEDSDDLFFIVDLQSVAPVENIEEEEEEDIVLDIADGACTASSNAAFLSCQAEIEEEYLIARGNCFNQTGSLAMVSCESLARAAMEEAEEECDDQFEARLALCAVIGEDPYDPVMSPSNFVTVEEMIANPNPWLPLVPGNQWIYEAEDEVITVTVTEDTREILGIESIVVHDVVMADGELIEDTDDWYAQDLDGNVWYMGEIARNYEDGRLADLDGSWEAGVNGAKAGILFRGNPVVGETLRQEFLLGEAEDIGETLSVTANETSGEDAGVACQENCLQVLEYTPVEPDVAEEKFYYPGIGKILSIDLEEGIREELIEYSVQ